MTSKQRATSDHGPAPEKAAVTRSLHRVAFYETDAMGVVHHANYVLFLELARIDFLDEHDVPYREYVAQNLHYAVTRVDIRYRQAARFDDEVETLVWVEWVRGASLAIGYELRCGERPIATARTEHAMVDGTGRVVRIPAERRRNLAKLAAR